MQNYGFASALSIFRGNHKMKNIRFNKRTLKTFLFIAMPLALQNLITVCINMVDNVMVGTLGDSAIATVNLANQFFFIFSLMVFGLSSGAAVFMAQFWGKKDYSGIRHAAGINLIAGLAAGLIFGIAAFFIPDKIMMIFSRDPAVIQGGAVYIKILSVTYPLTAATAAVSYLLKSVENVKIPLVSSLLSVGINIVFNYFLIFGKFGFPELGVAGAAWATLLARIVECVLIFTFALINVPFLRQNIKDYIKIPRDILRRFIKTAAPVMLNETLWSMGVSVYSIIYARTGNTPEEGTIAVAAVNISALAERLASTFSFGMGHAVSIIIGKDIGARKKKKALFNASQFAFFAPASGIIFGLIMIFFMPSIINLFNLSPQAEVYARHLIILLGIALPIKTFNTVNIIGTFRGGGDTTFACLLDVVSIWCLGIPTVAVAGLVLRLPLELVVATTFLEETVKCIIIITRLRNQKWLHDLVNVE